METKIINISANSNAKYVPVCLSNDELFIKEKGGNSLLVLRYMDKDDLEYWRSKDGMREYIKEIWQSAVAGDVTELGLDDYIEDYTSDLELDMNPEMYVNKDESFCGVFDEYPELRQIIDDYLYEENDVEVGTWECSGCYPVEGDVQIEFNIVD